MKGVTTSFFITLLLLLASLNSSVSTRSFTKGMAFASSPLPTGSGAGAETTAASELPLSQSAAASSAAAADATTGSPTDDLPRLPPVNPNSTEKVPTLKFGETLRLDEMGPIIINTDGTTRRIDNWNEMSPQEQEVAWRRIKKRNEERRSKLLEEQQVQQEQQQKGKEGEL